MSIADSVSLDLGNEDNRLKALIDKRCIKLIFLIIACSVVLYIPLRISAEHSGGIITGIKRDKNSSSINVDLSLSYDGESLEISPDLTVLAEGEKKKEVFAEIEQKSFLEAYAEKLIRELSNDSEGPELLLPSESDGVSLKWSIRKNEDPVWIFAGALMISLFLWFSRHDGIRKRREAEREQFISEAPNMILQLVMLLNAGFIADAAFDELIRHNRSSENYLYRVFSVLKEKAVSGNTVFVPLMYNYAQAFGDRDFLRFATLCVEHSHRGSELASKLDQERKLQQDSKMSRARAKAKEAETKLCFPLMLLLIALVVICIAPAVFEM